MKYFSIWPDPWGVLGFHLGSPSAQKIVDGALSRLGISYSGLAYEILVTIGVFLHLPLQREFLRFLQVLTVSRMIFPSKNHFCCCRNGPMFQVLTIKSEYYKDHSLIIPEVTGPQWHTSQHDGPKSPGDNDMVYHGTLPTKRRNVDTTRNTLSPIIMVQWKMGAWKMTGLSPFWGPFSTEPWLWDIRVVDLDTKGRNQGKKQSIRAICLFLTSTSSTKINTKKKTNVPQSTL